MKKLYTLLFLSIVLLVSGQTPGAENILYVNTAVTGGTGSGNSWNNAIKELSDALRWARQQNNFTSANPLKIYVAKGTYKPMYNAADGQFTSNGNRNNAFVMVNNVQLYGGFDPTNGIDDLTDTRLFGTNGSILSGDIGTVNVNTDNTHHIVISAGAVGSAGLDGFVITDGYANGGLTAITVNTNTIVAYYGAGMYNASSSPALKHVTITGNTASTSNSYAGGGGMYNASSNPVLTYVTISSNTAFSSSNYSGSYAYGGGMYNFSSSPVLTNVMISGNRAYAYSINAGGGGIYNFSSHPVLTNVTIANNKANGGTLAYSIGGGIVNSGSSPKIYNSIFWGNTKYNSTSSDIATSLTFTLKNSITQGYTTGVAADNNLVNTDPLFTNPAADDFSLQAVSVAINKGNNSFYTDPLIGGNLNTDKDLAGNPRLFANTIDIGAYENQNHPISPDSSNILYVNTAVAGGAGTGDSWSNAFKELSDALRWARQQNNFTSANPLKIYVAKGTYKPMYNAADGQFTSNGNRNNAFVMVNNVQLYGGFDPTNGIDDLTDTRIFGTGGSILSGDIGIVNVNTDNTHHIVISAGEVGSAGLDGFVITEGYANGTANMMVNAKEVYSTYGSGIHNISSSPAIKNVTVTGNTATTSSYAYGAGVYNASSNPVLTNVTISNNIATSTYSGAAGGGIHNNASNPILTNVTISSNTVSSSSSNSSSLGGGMYNTSSHPVLRNVTISSNTVSSSSSSSFSSGGGMHNHTSNPLLTNVTIRSNTATSSTDAFGGGMSNESSAPVLTNVTIANNKANGNSLTNSFDGGIRNNSSSPKIYNSIIWGNTRFDSTSSDLENSSGTTNSITLKNSITQGYTTGVAADNNLVNTDPLFTNPIAGDFSLQTFSVAINKGNNSFYTDPLIGNGNLGTDKDLAGNLRLFANTIDMGAYENQNPLTPDTNNILYINTAVTGGTGSGNSWNNAIKELSDALRWARQQNNFTSSNPLQIYVAKGTYKPLYNAKNGQFTSNGNRNNAFVMVNNVQLYGGFDPANGVDDLTHTRLFGTNGSVLSGDIGTVNVNTDNTYHVVISSGAVGSAGLDGFVITEGYANGTTNIIVNAAMFYPYNGAGMYNITSSPAIKNVTITGNAAFSSTPSGGGMYNQSSSPILTKVIISNNTAAGSSYSYGGGMYNINSNAVLTNVSISSNTATTSSSSSSSPNYSSAAGGGIYGQNSNLVLTNVMITDNTASSSSSPAYGGGMYHVVSSPILTNVTIANNKANGYRIVESFGGGFYNYSSTTKIYNSIFWGNTKFNTTSSDIETNSAVTLKNSITQGYTTGVAVDNNLVNVNPLFSNAASGDFSILANSPANDMGNNSYYTDPLIGNGNLVSDKDLAGNNRVSVCAIDMGAYEYQDPDQYTRWENAAWSNVTGPTAGLSACINDSYQLSTGFTTKHLKVQLGSLTIQPNSTVKVYGHITQSADNKIVLENDANLIQTDNTASNDAHKIAVKRSTHMRKMDYTYWGSPVGNQKLLNNTAQNDGFSVGTPNSSIYNYNEPDDYLVQTNDQYFVPGRGYAIRGKDSFSDTNLTPETYQFNGTINNGVYTAQVQKSKNTTVESIEYEHGYNLVGNPYPSNIDFEALYNFGTNKNYIKGKVRFLSNGSPQLNQNGSAYTSNGYASLTLMGGAPPTTIQPNLDLIPTQYIKAGQGFIVQVRDASSITTPDPVVSHPLVFDNSIRTDQAGVFYNARGAASSKDRFWVQLISPQQFTNTILLGYAPDATNQFDDDYDADLIDIGDDALYSLTGAQKLHIQGRQGPLVESDTVPLGTKYAQSGNYQIAIGRGEGIFAGSQDIYLKDKLLNKIVNISEAAYHFQAIKGAEEDRFEIVYKPQTSLGTGSSAHKEFIVYKDEIDFVVKSSDILKKIQLYDMSGRLLGEVRGNFNELRISHQFLVNGAYILKIYNGDHMVTKKVIK